MNIKFQLPSFNCLDVEPFSTTSTPLCAKTRLYIEMLFSQMTCISRMTCIKALFSFKCHLGDLFTCLGGLVIHISVRGNF